MLTVLFSDSSAPAVGASVVGDDSAVDPVAAAEEEDEEDEEDEVDPSP